MNNMPLPHDTLITLTTDIVAAHVSNNTVSVGDVSQLITNVHAALNGLSTPIKSEGVIVKSGVCPSGSVPVRLIVHRYSILKPDVIHDQLQLVEPLDPLPAFLGGLEQFEHHR